MNSYFHSKEDDEWQVAKSETSECSSPSFLAEQVRELDDLLEDKSWLDDTITVVDDDEIMNEIDRLIGAEQLLQQELEAVETFASKFLDDCKDPKNETFVVEEDDDTRESTCTMETSEGDDNTKSSMFSAETPQIEAFERIQPIVVAAKIESDREKLFKRGSQSRDFPISSIQLSAIPFPKDPEGLKALSREDPDGVYCEMGACPTLGTYPKYLVSSLRQMGAPKPKPEPELKIPSVIKVSSDKNSPSESSTVESSAGDTSTHTATSTGSSATSNVARMLSSMMSRAPNSPKLTNATNVGSVDSKKESKVVEVETVKDLESNKSSSQSWAISKESKDTNASGAPHNYFRDSSHRPVKAQFVSCRLVVDDGEKIVEGCPVEEVEVTLPQIRHNPQVTVHMPAEITRCAPDTDIEGLSAMHEGSAWAGDNGQVTTSDDEKHECSSQWRMAVVLMACLLFAGAVLAALLITKPFSSPVLVPPNDYCKSALGFLPTNSSLTYGSTIDATIDNVGACGTAVKPGKGVWYKLQGRGASITASTCLSADFDTQIAVFAGGCEQEQLSCVVGNDNGVWSQCGLHSSVTWTAAVNETYFVLVKGSGTEMNGNFALGIEETISNDLCQAAIGPIPANGKGVSGWTINATFDDTPVCGSVKSNGRGVWYTVTGTGRPFVASTCQGTAFDSQISVFRGGCGDLECIDANNDFCGSQSSVRWPSEQGEIYYIMIHGDANSAGLFSLTVTESGGIGICETASGPLPTTDYTMRGSTVNSTISNAPVCGLVSEPTMGVFYWVKGNGNLLTASTCNSLDSSFDTQLALYSGGCGELTCLEANDNYCGKLSSLSWISIPDETYYILVTGKGKQTGSFDLYLDQSKGGESCSYAIPSPSDENGSDYTEVAGSTIGSTYYDLNAATCGPEPQSPTVWYSVTGTGKQMTASTCGGLTDFKAVFAVYEGSCDTLECVEGSSSRCGSERGQQFLSWDSSLGKKYFIAVYGDLPRSAGPFIIRLLSPKDIESVPSGASEQDDLGLETWVYAVVGCGAAVLLALLVYMWIRLRATDRY